ncbi:sulfotransferase [bacterium]|nr:sulfotransferase [bacterium]
MNRDDNAPVQPVIVIGMHRSGTSMVTDVLESLGLFSGVCRDPNEEAWFFLKLNDWLLEQSGGNWENPQPIRWLLGNPDIRLLAADYIRHVFRTPGIVSFLGWKRFLACRSLEAIGEPWGWKDPRNTFTLPLWLDLFPEAKVIHIFRHGVDVAQSLRTRQRAVSNPAAARALFEQRKPLYYLRRKASGFIAHMRCASLEGGFSLWEEYMREAQRHVQRLGVRAAEVRYEEFLERPVDHLRQLAPFCGLSATDAQIGQAAARIDTSRAFAYRADKELSAFAESVHERLEAFGY